jgi:hypothetical protein
MFVNLYSLALFGCVLDANFPVFFARIVHIQGGIIVVVVVVSGGLLCMRYCCFASK